MKSFGKACAHGALGVLACTGLAWAQQPAADADANAPTERAKRQADNPYKWIMIMDDKPRPKKDEPKEKPQRAPAREAAPAAAPAAAAAPASAPAARSFEPRTPAAAVAAPAPIPSAALIENPSASATAAVAAVAPAKLPEPEPEEPLRVLAQAQPELTRQILNANIEKGRVKVKYTVNPDGSVSDAEIVNTTNRALNSSVLAALKQWKYAPIKQARETQVEFAFDLSR